MPDKDAEWVFEVNGPMGGASGEAYTNTLASSGMPPEAVLARESIQNSVDAWDKSDEKVHLDFVLKEITGAEKKSIVDAAGLHAIATRAVDLKFTSPNCLGTLSDSKASLKLLYINDYNTTGLAGDPMDSDSKFFKFLLALGDGGKEHDEHGTGGSYGFGKSVYSSNSGILTIFAYSRTVDGSGKPMSLFFGCGYYRKHKQNGKSHTGRAWYGANQTGSDALSPQLVVPLRDAEADAMAASLGFEPRDANQIGTSVLVVDAMVDADEIIKGVEDWWWPRLVSHQLDVRLIDAEGIVRIPRPRKREDLQPFLDAFDLASGKSPGNNKTEFRKLLSKMETTSLGAVGFKVLERNEKDQFAVPEARIDSVALIRSPLMVVAYLRPWNVGNPAMAGAFIADDEIDDVLRSAEPPQHDRWDPTARRLQDATGHNRQIVQRVLGRIRSGLTACQKTASPPPPPRPKRLTLLERTLASFLTPAKKGTKSNTHEGSAPIHLTYDKEPKAEAVGDKIKISATFRVKLKADEDMSSILARLKVSCPVIEDGQAGDSLAVSIKTTTVLAPDEEHEGWQTFDLTSVGAKFECETEPYDPLWTVRFVPELEAAEAK